MAWYTAHLILGFLVEGAEEIVAWEDIVIIKAESDDNAMSLARDRGRAEELVDDDLLVDGCPAKRKFYGVRKLLAIDDMPEEYGQTISSIDVSFSELIVRNEEDLKKLGRGENVSVVYTGK